MSAETFRDYIRDLVFQLREEGAFQQGRALAYVEVLARMQGEADAFGLAREELLLAGFDPVNDPLDPPSLPRRAL